MVWENMKIGTEIGTFEAINEEEGDYSLSLVGGVGSEDNYEFELKNRTLVTKVMFNYELKAYHSIRLRIRHSNG